MIILNQELTSLFSWRPTKTKMMMMKKPPCLQTIRATTTTTTLMMMIQEETSVSSKKELREMRNVKRDENRRNYPNWRQDVEEKLLQKKPKKQFNSWKEELNLDKLSELGPQWWILKVSRAKGKDTLERMMQSLHKNFPDTQFKVISFFLSFCYYYYYYANFILETVSLIIILFLQHSKH